jgi:HTH-type transcriptional regulator, competence development regulator
MLQEALGANMDLGGWLRSLGLERCEAKGLSLRDVAKKIKVSPTFLSKVETEDWKPGEEKLRKIAEVIACDPDDLLARAGRVPTELSEIIKQSPHRHEMTALLRTAKGFTAEHGKTR